MHKQATPADGWQRWQVQSLLGEAIAADPSRYAEAEQLLLEAAGQMALQPDADEPALRHIAKTRARLASLYESWDKPELAAEWRADQSGQSPPAPAAQVSTSSE
jgi:hypothetical protein